MSLRHYLRQLWYYDWLLMAVVLILCAFSLAALYGIAIGFEQPNFINVQKQAIFIVLGVVIMLATAAFGIERISRYAAFGYGLAMALLLAVLWFGQTLHGTTGWFTLGLIGFQPVELAKLALIIALAKVFSDRTSVGPLSARRLLFSGGLTAVYGGLSAVQPDFGSAALLVVIWMVMVGVAGISRRQALTLGLLLLSVATIGWFFLLHDYQRSRIVSFLNPAADPYGRGYQVRQSIIAIGSGQLFGRGLGSGSQSQLKFIPASQTDFIFAVIAEELGLVGAGLVLLAYLILFYRLWVLAGRASSDFAGHLIVGISALLFGQVTINIGMNIGLLPVTGIGLPFLSYGGSYLVITFALVGLAQGVAASSVKYRA